MKIYQNIRVWRWALLFSAVVIVVVSLWYTNNLAKKVAQDEKTQVSIWAQAIERRAGLVNYTDDFFEELKDVERKRVELWADAIQRRAELVNYTDEFFDEIRTEERKRAEIWAEASRRLSNSEADASEDLSFYVNILSANTTIPVVVTDEKGNIQASKNVDFDEDEVKVLTGKIKKKFTRFQPIVFYDLGTISVIYYEESRLYSKLRIVLDDLIESFLSDVVTNAASVPVIITDSTSRNVVTYGNIDSASISTPERLKSMLKKMSDENEPIRINLAGHGNSHIYYENSKLFTSLKELLDNHIEEFLEEVVTNSASVPVLITDSSSHKVIAYGGGISEADINKDSQVDDLISRMADQNTPIEIKLPIQGKRYIYYEDSYLLTQLRYFPFVQLLIIAVFIFAVYVLLNITRKSEQDQVWAGMAKETAHQLGTPISSMMAWLELLQMQQADDQIVQEIKKDVSRLEIITERFSKIGSTPSLQTHKITRILVETAEYMKSRSSSKVQYVLDFPEELNSLDIELNKHLFTWVIENLLRNAIDAMEGVGTITMAIQDEGNHINIDVSDTGKGIPKNKMKVVFNPGYTTKKRGWGLGLSLSERIIKNYHKGRIFVKSSAVGQGTTFRIVLNK